MNPPPSRMRIGPALLILGISTLLHPPAPAEPVAVARNESTIENAGVNLSVFTATGLPAGIESPTSTAEFLSGPSGPLCRLFVSSQPDLWKAVEERTLEPAAPPAVTTEKTGDDARLRLVYDRWPDWQARVTLTATLHGDDPAIAWTCEIKNDGPGTVVGVEAPRLTGLRALDDGALRVPYWSGWILSDPWTVLKDARLGLQYPVPASMPLLDYGNDRMGISIQTHDPKIAMHTLHAGGPDRELTDHHLPYIAPGGTWTSPPVVTALRGGDWHATADRYRAWASTWMKPPGIPKWVREFHSWDEMMLVGPQGSPGEGTYADILPRWRKAKAHGATAVHLVGWFENGHDTNYPDYEPIARFGGAEALAKAIGEVQADPGGRGVHAPTEKPIDSEEARGRVIVYLNCRIGNLKNPTLQAHFNEWTVRKADGGYVKECYNRECFAVLCPYVKAWRDHLGDVIERIARDYKADGAQLDQASSPPSVLCYNREHGHATPATAFSEGMVAMLREYRQRARAINPEFMFWVEGSHDVHGQYVDVHLTGCEGGGWPVPYPGGRACPELLRYAFPEYTLISGANGGKGETPEWAFVLGKPFTSPKARYKPYLDIYDRAPECFYEGVFRDDVGLTVEPKEIMAKLHVAKDGSAAVVALWNRGDTAANVAVSLKRGAVFSGEGSATQAGAWRVTGAEDLSDMSDVKIENGDTLRFTIALPAHDARAVRVKPTHPDKQEAKPADPPSTRKHQSPPK